MSTEESNWESKLIFDLSDAELVPIDVLHVILFVFQYFSIFQVAKGAPGERTFLKNKRIFMLSDLYLVTIDMSIHFFQFFTEPLRGNRQKNLSEIERSKDLLGFFHME